MEIVQATDQDIPEVVALMKMSLGESLIPKSTTFFTWKHIHNPFGKSFNYVAKEDGKIIGLRTFMQWAFEKDGKIIRAVRAVDTATHPDHQGKGIFRKLTMHALEACKAEGIHIVFNSPNNSSRPGYLKMGWKEVGRMPLHLGLGYLIPASYSEKNMKRAVELFDINAALSKWNNDETVPKVKGKWATAINKSYLKWRYADCPVADYGAIIEPGQFGMVFRMKRLKNFMELRVCEAWSNDGQGQKALNKAFQKLKRTIRPAMVSCAPNSLMKTLPCTWGPFAKGPITTVRDVTLTDLSSFENFSLWEPSIGVMELF
jgi:GNAT superfamily N-acetyltransferase